MQDGCMSNERMQPAAERAYDFVKEKIIDGSFEPSQMLSEASLATEMGISRTPMHEDFLRANRHDKCTSPGIELEEAFDL